jgi:hypothetical protein
LLFAGGYTQPGRVSLLGKVLCDVECIIFSLMLLSLHLPVQSRSIMAAGRYAFGALLRLELSQLLSTQQCLETQHHLREEGMRCIYAYMGWQHGKWPMDLLRSLYMCQLYTGSGHEARAVLIAIENQLNCLSADNGSSGWWAGSMSVEHILPQVCWAGSGRWWSMRKHAVHTAGFR